LPDTFSYYIHKQLDIMRNHNFTKTEINQLERLLPLLKQGDEKLKQQFKEFVDEHDRRRGTKFLESIPSMRLFYNHIN